mmetsp:Transcript_6050/g.25008  ORF Transcript_6050/g.25008 Transcript_6050/m.25008 type:complete len:594 (-) Transcript_6050:898-2679(-)
MGVDSVVDWTWRRVRDELKHLENLEDERGGARVNPNPNPTTLLDRSIQLEAYEEYADELEKAWRLAAKEEKATRLREERRRRDAFVASLRRRRARGTLGLRMPWRTFAANVLEDDVAFLEMSRNLSGSRPRELYDDEQEEMEAFAAEDRALVEAAAAKVGFEIVANVTTRDALAAAVRGVASLPARVTGETGDGDGDEKSAPGEEVDGEEVDGAHPRRVDSKEEDEAERLRVACGDAVAAAKDRARLAARRKERALDDFYHLLRSRRRDVPIAPSSTWADVERALAGERALDIRPRRARRDWHVPPPGPEQVVEVVQGAFLPARRESRAVLRRRHRVAARDPQPLRFVFLLRVDASRVSPVDLLPVDLLPGCRLFVPVPVPSLSRHPRRERRHPAHRRRQRVPRRDVRDDLEAHLGRRRLDERSILRRESFHLLLLVVVQLPGPGPGEVPRHLEKRDVVLENVRRERSPRHPQPERASRAPTPERRDERVASSALLAQTRRLLLLRRQPPRLLELVGVFLVRLQLDRSVEEGRRVRVRVYPSSPALVLEVFEVLELVPDPAPRPVHDAVHAHGTQRRFELGDLFIPNFFSSRP